MATVEGPGSQDPWQVPDLWLRPDEIVYQQLLTQLEAAASHGNGFELSAIEVSVLVRRRKHFPDALQQGQAVVDLPAPSPNEAPPTLAELLPHLQQIEALAVTIRTSSPIRATASACAPRASSITSLQSWTSTR